MRWLALALVLMTALAASADWPGAYDWPTSGLPVGAGGNCTFDSDCPFDSAAMR